MEGFDELKSQWGKQPQLETPKDGVKEVMEKIKLIRTRQQTTNIILAITGIVLIFFFFYISAYKVQTVMLGLLLMIGALTIRVVIEFLSIKTLKSLNTSIDGNSYRLRLTGYYKNRMRVHFIVTPLIIIVYCIGFIILTPSFKIAFTKGFYSYIIISATVLLIVFTLLIAKQIKRELRMLKSLNLR